MLIGGGALYVAPVVASFCLSDTFTSGTAGAASLCNGPNMVLSSNQNRFYRRHRNYRQNEINCED